MAEADVTINECVSIDDFKQCVELERAIYKDNDIGVMPIRLYMISKSCNAPTFGAFDKTGRMVGFVHTMIALLDGQVVYHSYSAAVLEELRHRGIGYRLKLAQRVYALEAGVPLIVWSFDPLISRNAHTNINKLGAIVRRYSVNHYGENISTVFETDLPTDRIFAEWWIESPHTLSALAGNRPQVDNPSATVAIPDDINAVRARSLEDHRHWRLRAREDLQRELGGGSIIRGFARDPEKGEGRYLFGPDEEQFHFSAYSSDL
ncbi:MAG: hypothetical protein L0229_08940 [Blastocatellia bacterium]|nr:hypothetical protein [Blastocatellia bacterium]